MKKLIGTVLLAVSAITQAEIKPFNLERTMKCGDFEDLVYNLQNQFQEQPVMKFKRTGSDGKVAIVFFINFESGTTTVVEVIENGTSCILTEGENMGVFQQKGKSSL